jgi:ABC-type transport system involved in cytochrome bd biosynthesis fused ATPase/permease subunit
VFVDRKYLIKRRNKEILIKVFSILSFRLFYEKFKDKTRIIATHSVNDWRNCDKVIELERGEITFQGNLNEYNEYKTYR